MVAMPELRFLFEEKNLMLFSQNEKLDAGRRAGSLRCMPPTDNIDELAPTAGRLVVLFNLLFQQNI